MRAKPTALAVLLLVVLAGCTGGPGAGGPTDAPPTATEDNPTTTRTPNDYQTPPNATPTPTPSPTPTPTEDSPGMGEDGYYNAFTFEATAVSPEDVAHDLATSVDELYNEERPIVEAVLANGSTTVTELSHGETVPETPGPLEDGAFVRHDGTYYRVNATVVDSTRDRGYQFELEGPVGNLREDVEPPENATAFEDLSAVERDLFEYAMPSERAREAASVIAGVHYLPPEGATLSGSEWLDGDPHYVNHSGDVFRVQYEGERPPVVRIQVRYSLEPVADSASEFVAPRLSDLVVNVTDGVPPEPGRSVLLSAVENGTYEWEGTTETRPEAVEAADRWIGQQNPSHSFAYLRYEGQIYRIQVTEVIE